MISYVSDYMIREIYLIDFYDGVCKAERIMEEKNADCLPVLRDGKLVGILSSSDIRKSHHNRIAADTMTKNVVTISPNASLWEAKQLLDKHKVKKLVVVDNGELRGLISEIQICIELAKCIDTLTGLYRSDYIYFQGIELMKKGVDISVIFIDLNKFGQIDKEYGHAQGDTILVEVGALLKDNVPGENYLCRYGGDEFVVLTAYELEQSKALANRLLESISGHHFNKSIGVTASAGISYTNNLKKRTYSPIDTIFELINLASLASSKAKKEKFHLLVAEEFADSEIA